MVDIKRVIKQRPSVQRPDPYRLLEISVNGKKVGARPIAFDLGPDGFPLEANRAVAQCPDCCAGVEYDLGGLLEFVCYHCSRVSAVEPEFSEPGVLYDPFVNPFLEGLLGHEEADSDLVGLLGDRDVENSTARQRMASVVIHNQDTTELDAAMASLEDEDLDA